jgi:Zn-dependent protease
LFLIVLLHEFGHSLACRQVGGQANTIMLWPLGGVAYVAPPQRPGAVLWSIAAGPLVNVALFVILSALIIVDSAFAWTTAQHDLHEFLRDVWKTNFGLLLFNILPVYPLDGGQILRALLWFFLGRARSLFAVASIGFLGVAGLAALAYSQKSLWLGVITYFVFQQCMAGLAQAKALRTIEKIPRREGYACPSCGSPPPFGPIWKCHRCQNAFDMFSTMGQCPGCHELYPEILCIDCRTAHPLTAWRR